VVQRRGQEVELGQGYEGKTMLIGVCLRKMTSEV